MQGILKMRKFSDVINEATGTIVFTFGRFNPPTTGHEKLIKKVASVAGSMPFRIYPSQSNNPKKDPLPFALKVAYMRKMFPRYAKNIKADKNARTAIEIAVKLYKEGFHAINMVVGSDRVKEFQTLLDRYNGVEARHGYYGFDDIRVISAGERDPDAEGVEGMSASKMRAAATAGDFDSFKMGVPSGFRDALKLYNDVRKYMGIREERDMGEMNDFETLRDMYLTGKIWNVGDIVEANGAKGKVIRKGTNYLSFVDENNKVHKAWLYDIEEQKKITKVKQAKGEVGDVKGTQPAKYYAKGAGGKDMSKSTAVARARFFAKGADKPDDDPDSYKPAPGDKGKKTRPSQYTKKYKQMYGEKLGKDADAGDYIDDFRKSKAPQFKGKSDKKIRDMAIAAYLDAKDKKEETDMKFYQIDEKIAGLVKKSKQTGVPYGILKKSYDRGMAAWKTGHRPGTTPQQWAFARVNSMLTGGKADPDLQPKVRAAKKAKKAKKEEVTETMGVLDMYGKYTSKEKEQMAKLQKMLKDLEKGKKTPGKGFAKIKVRELIKSLQEKPINEWFESNRTRAIYQLRHGDDWWWKLNEVHDKMLEKLGLCCDDCGEELNEAMYHHVLNGKIVASGSKSKMQSLVKKNGKPVFKGPDSNYVLNSPGAKIGDIKEEMTSEDSLRNWEHEDAKGYAEKLIDEYGQPDEVTETMLKWNKLGSFGEDERETYIIDESIPHAFPKPHRDYVYTVMNIKIPSDMLDTLGHVTGSIIYDGLKEEVTARCGSLYANAATMGFVRDMVDGKVPVEDGPAKDEYADRITKDPLPKFYDNRMNEGVEHMCGHCLDESLWANIHKKRQRIKRGSGERMRKKGEKGAPTAAQMRRAKGEELMNYIERKMSTLKKDKDLPNLMIPKKGKAGVTKFQKRSGGRSRLDSPYTMMMKNSWDEVTEAAEYQGRKVQLNNPTRGDVKKFKVYVKNDKGNVVKVEFGDPNMEIKRDDPARRKSFRARHNCDNPGPKYKARYGSCKFWEKGKSVSDLMKG